jgi:hypothetical protein
LSAAATRSFGRHDQPGSPVQRLRCRQGQLDRVRLNQRNVFAFLGGNIFRQFQMNGAGALLLRDAKGLTYQSRNHSGRDDLTREFRQRLHRRNDVHDLEARLA